MNGRQIVDMWVLFVSLLIFAAGTAQLTGAQESVPNAADASIQTAYQKVVDAANVGADTSQLITQINYAINLAQQSQSLRYSDPEQAQELLTQAQEISQNVTAQAQKVVQESSALNPFVQVSALFAGLVVGILVFLFIPRLFWRLWFRYRKNCRISVAVLKPKSDSFVLTPEKVCGMILVIIMLVTSFSAVGVLMPGMRGERFSELGILGPDLKLGDYPTVVVASETVHFYTYVGNQMGEPMFYTVLVKLTDNSTQAVPANVSAIAQSQRVLSDNETWICPVDVTFSHVGDNQRLIFELWVYNQTLQIDQYHNRWGQIWLNVTKPDV